MKYRSHAYLDLLWLNLINYGDTSQQKSSEIQTNMEFRLNMSTDPSTL